MKALLLFGAVVVACVLVLGGLFALVFSSAEERRAIQVSAVVAVVVQMFAFAIARFMPKSNFLAGWLIGVALRLVILLGYGVVAVKAFGMPAPAALISLVTFLFISTLVEPKLLTI